MTRISRMKPWLLLPSVKSVSSVVKIFLPPFFCRRPRFMNRVAKPGIRNPAPRRIRTIAPAGNAGPAGFSTGGNGGGSDFLTAKNAEKSSFHSSLFAFFEFFAVTHSVEASAVGRKMGGRKMNAFFKGQDGPRMARMKPWLLLPSVKSVKSVVKIFLPPSFCRRPQLMNRIAKPGIRASHGAAHSDHRPGWKRRAGWIFNRRQRRKRRLLSLSVISVCSCPNRVFVLLPAVTSGAAGENREDKEGANLNRPDHGQPSFGFHALASKSCRTDKTMSCCLSFTVVFRPPFGKPAAAQTR